MAHLGHMSIDWALAQLPLVIWWVIYPSDMTLVRHLVQYIEWRKSYLFLCCVPARNDVRLLIVAHHVESIVQGSFMGSRRCRKVQGWCFRAGKRLLRMTIIRLLTARTPPPHRKARAQPWTQTPHCWDTHRKGQQQPSHCWNPHWEGQWWTPHC